MEADGLHVEHPGVGRRDRLLELADWGLGRHRVEVTPVPLVMIRATEHPIPSDPEAWTQFTEAGLAVVDVPGDHHSMLAPPHVDRVAEAVQTQLDAVLTPA